MTRKDHPSTPDYIAAFQAIDTPCALIDPGGVVQDANQAFAARVSDESRPIRKQDCVGSHLADLAPRQHIERTRAETAEALGAGKSATLTTLFDGEPTGEALGQAQLEIITDCDGHVNGALITARVNSEESIRMQAVQQAQKMEAIGQLTAGIAHNFNNMLQGIVSNLELAQLEAGQKIKVTLDNALQSSQHAAEMVQQLLMFSRQGVRASHRTVDMVKVIRDTEAICLETFDRKISMTVDWRPMPPTVGDSMQLQQVFLNLCINARDALEESDQSAPAIQIELDAAEISAEDAYPETAPGPYLLVRVCDNGDGMDEETRKRIFEPFFTTKSVDKGTGLGLSTAFGIVRDHKGWIECDSESGSGTRFCVYLPVATRAAQEPDRPQPASVRGTETILVIDDEEMVRNTAQQMLELRGYTALAAADGQEGLDVFDREAGAIDLVLLDQSMPRMSGQDVLVKLREAAPELKVIIFTGFAVKVDEFEGADDIVQKPFTLANLVAKVREVLDRDD